MITTDQPIGSEFRMTIAFRGQSLPSVVEDITIIIMLSRCNLYVFSRLAVIRPPVSCRSCLAMNGVGRPRRQPYPFSRSDLPAEQLGSQFSRCLGSDSQRPPPINDNSQNLFQRFKTVAKKYWYIMLPVHLVTSAVWFGSFYFIASSGVDVPTLLSSLGCPDWIVEKVKNGNSWTSYLVIAYGLYKICTPFRYMVTLGGTSMTIRYLRKFGYIIRDPGSPKKP